MMNRKGAYQAALTAMQRHLLARTDGCVLSGSPDGNDWILDCKLQTRTYWAVHEITVLMTIIE